MKHITLNDKVRMPALGLGTWKAKGDIVIQAIINAIKMGYRHIDTAMIYDNEVEVGQAIAQAIDLGLCRREDLFITSKLWNDRHDADDVLPALEASLKRLNLNYLDLYLIHWPVAFKSGVILPESSQDYQPLSKAPLAATWKAMEAVKRTGLTKAIGVSNFTLHHLESLNAHSETPAVNQVEMHPLLTQKALRDYGKKHGMVLTAYAPLGSTDRAEGMKAQDEPDLFELSELKLMAERYQCTPAQLLIAFHINRGDSVIPKAVQTTHLSDNLAAASIELSKEDLTALEGLNRDYRFINGHFFDCPEQGYDWVFAHP